MNNDLISRSALKTAIEDHFDNLDAYFPSAFIKEVEEAPTALFPLTVIINDNVTGEDIENLKRLMKDYKPQILNLENERLQG